MSDGATLSIRGLSVRRGGQPVLAVDELTLEAGETLALVGPNGAGKSTLLLTVMKLIARDGGSVILDGVDADDHSSITRYRRNFAMVFQEPLLLNTSVRDNVAAGLRLRRCERAETARRVALNLERFGIAHLALRSARTLSGGEAQRVSLARALALEPRVLLLDEPFASLDAPTRDRILYDLQLVLAETGTTVIMATHDRQEALALADRIAVMSDGAIVQCGTAAELASHPNDEFVASFMGNDTILAGGVTTVFDGSFLVSVGERSIEIVGLASVGDRVSFCIHPENIILSHEAGLDTSARNSFSGLVTGVTSMGLFCRVNVDCGFPLITAITNHSRRLMALEPGDTVYATFKSTAVHVMALKKTIAGA